MPRPDGKPYIYEILGFDSREEYDAALAQDRARWQESVGWPEEENCPGCDGHRERGPHRLSCSFASTRLAGPLEWILMGTRKNEC